MLEYSPIAPYFTLRHHGTISQFLNIYLYLLPTSIFCHLNYALHISLPLPLKDILLNSQSPQAPFMTPILIFLVKFILKENFCFFTSIETYCYTISLSLIVPCYLNFYFSKGYIFLIEILSLPLFILNVKPQISYHKCNEFTCLGGKINWKSWW